MIRHSFIVIAFLVATASSTDAQRTSTASKRVEHLQHGVSLSGWFAESSNYSNQQLRNYTTPTDIEHIHSLGFDHVRIPVDPAIFQCEREWDSCERIQMLDQVIQKALSVDLAVILDFHADAQYTHQLATNEQAVEKYLRLWGQIADHYAAMDHERIFLEVMNEFSVSDSYRWSGILQEAVKMIRRHSPESTILVAGAGFSDIWDLVLLPNIPDSNLIYNFHYYEPHIFTHQGANWGLDWWKDIHNLPFPATLLNVADTLDKEENQTARWKLLEYGEDHWNADRIASDIDFVAKWAHDRNVPLICDEFGVYRNFSAPEDRERWLTATRTAFEKNHIGWTMWDYQGGFGVVYKEGGTLRDDDVVLRALGLKK